MRHLPIDVDDLAILLASGEEYDDVGYRLDLNTGEISCLEEDNWEEEVLDERFLRIPPSLSSGRSYRAMADFIETLPESRMKSRLQETLRGRGAFRRFSDTIRSFPSEESRWLAFREQKAREQALQWLADHEIAPLEWKDGR